MTLREAREHLGLTQEAAAARLGSCLRTIRQLDYKPLGGRYERAVLLLSMELAVEQGDAALLLPEAKSLADDLARLRCQPTG